MKVYREQSSEKYLPAWHGRHTDDADREYVPSGHMFDVELVLPEAQAYPAGQVELVLPGWEPKNPPSHGPVQLGDVRAGVDPYVPGGHAVHVALPAKLYCPGGHATAVGVADPAGHTYPAVQGPLHTASVSPGDEP